MCEILRSEFDDAFRYVSEDIRNSDFIAFDTEFTGLRLSEKERSSLFDTSEARYQKLRRSVAQFLPSQIGIAAFTKKDEANTYMVRAYNFYLHPMSFGSLDVRFVVQTSSFEFLCGHNFDFNKFVYHGVSFLNEAQEKCLREQIKSEVQSGLDRDVDEQDLRQCCSLVAEWVLTAVEGEQFEVPGPQAVSDYITLTELRQRFPDTWASIRDDGQLLVERVSAEKRKEMEALIEKDEAERVLNQMLGFTRIFRVLTEVKKPLVGHNCFTDLLFLYDKFYKPLPESFSKFKQDIGTLFPQIFDTKHMVNTIRKKFSESLEKSGLLECTSLSGLHAALETEKGRFFTLYSPGVLHDEGFDRYRDVACPHEAGYDAYMAGNVFLRLAHIITVHSKELQQTREHNFYEYLIGCRRFKNCINLIRGSTDFARLDGPDPPSRRPQYLYVRSRKWNSPLNSSLVAQLFSAYGCVDVQMTDKTQALVAIGNHGTARDILRKFRHHQLLHVCYYSILKHNPVVRRLLWTGVAASAGMCVWVMWTGLR